DAYRIQSSEELESIGWSGHGEELREGAVIAIEWARMIRPALGDDFLWVEIEHAPAGRRISLSAEGNWRDKMPQFKSLLQASGAMMIEEEEPLR
nr:hypothetical protein [Phycisphaeraceae bacterium]